MGAWWGIVGPAGLPAPIVNKVASAMRPIVEAPAFAARYAAMGVVPGRMGPDAFAQLIRDDRVRFEEIARSAGIQPEG
jgi:tripartite-type tricarboxylate transporter receptor subunit TctC